MTAIAKDVDERLQQLDIEQASRLEQAVRALLKLTEPTSRAKAEPLPFPLIKGTPGNIVNPTREQLDEF